MTIPIRRLINAVAAVVLGAWAAIAYMVPFDPLRINTVRLCADCENVILDDLRSPRCRLFGKVDPVFGTTHFQDCRATRANASQCGAGGAYYFRQRPFGRVGSPSRVTKRE